MFVPGSVVDEVVRSNAATLVSGPWGSGKTTLLRACRELRGMDHDLLIDDADRLSAEEQNQLAGRVSRGTRLIVSTRHPSRLHPALARALAEAEALRITLGPVSTQHLDEWASASGVTGISSDRLLELSSEAGANGRVLAALLRDDADVNKQCLRSTLDLFLAELSSSGRAAFDLVVVADRVPIDVVERLASSEGLLALESLQAIGIEQRSAEDWVSVAVPAFALMRFGQIGPAHRRAWLQKLLDDARTHERLHQSREFLVSVASWSVSVGGGASFLRDGMHAAMVTGQFVEVVEFAGELLRRSDVDTDAAHCLSIGFEAMGEHARAAAVERLVRTNDHGWTMRQRTNALLATRAEPEAPSQVLDAITDPNGEGQAHICWFHLFSGDVDGAARLSSEVLNYVESSAQAFVWAAFANVAAEVVLGAGAECLAVLEPAISKARADGVNPFAELQIGAARLLALLRFGDVSVVYADAVRLADEETVPLFQAVWRGYAGLAARELGRFVDAAASFRFVLDQLSGDPWGARSWVESELRVSLAMSGQSLDDHSAETNPLGFVLPLVLRNRAWELAAVGRLAESQRSLTDAIAFAEQRHQIVHVVLCAVDLARFGLPGAASRAVASVRSYANPLVRAGLQVISALESLDPDRLREAASVARQVGWSVVADELVVLRVNAYLRRREPNRAASSELVMADGTQRTPLLFQNKKRLLAPRERETARRAVDGASSSQIAMELGLSTRTVDNLLGRVYRKCGTSGRDGLARAIG